MVIRATLPFGIGEIEWAPNDTQRRAAWALYVELVTRVATTPKGEGPGDIREALTSLHSIFSTTRQILRDAGPKVGISVGSVGGIAIAVLNKGLRPFLTRWHPSYSRWERERGTGVDRWPEEASFWADLTLLQGGLDEYATQLARAARVRANPRKWLSWLSRGSRERQQGGD